MLKYIDKYQKVFIKFLYLCLIYSININNINIKI